MTTVEITKNIHGVDKALSHIVTPQFPMVDIKSPKNVVDAETVLCRYSNGDLKYVYFVISSTGKLIDVDLTTMREVVKPEGCVPISYCVISKGIKTTFKF